VTGEHLVVDASAVIDLFVTDAVGRAVEARLDGAVLHAPAHLDAEVLTGLGRLHRAGGLTAAKAAWHLDALASAPIERHALQDLLTGGWKRRGRLRLADALYVELAAHLGVPLVTTDVRLSKATRVAEAVTA
jgi:predicted nucleic acid-binding protein